MLYVVTTIAFTVCAVLCKSLPRLHSSASFLQADNGTDVPPTCGALPPDTKFVLFHLNLNSFLPRTTLLTHTMSRLDCSYCVSAICVARVHHVPNMDGSNMFDHIQDAFSIHSACIYPIGMFSTCMPCACLSMRLQQWVYGACDQPAYATCIQHQSHMHQPLFVVSVATTYLALTTRLLRLGCSMCN